eukprot:GHVN01073639.1.p1 GENE.GHVN01073639.1~~GHVN01073639.1.p1  ORF type:complete len:993 (+),score=116.58 GHVN01073639.1:1708-4686(+)
MLFHVPFPFAKQGLDILLLMNVTSLMFFCVSLIPSSSRVHSQFWRTPRQNSIPSRLSLSSQLGAERAAPHPTYAPFADGNLRPPQTQHIPKLINISNDPQPHGMAAHSSRATEKSFSYTTTPSCPPNYKYYSSQGKCVSRTEVPLTTECPSGSTKQVGGECVERSIPTFDCPPGAQSNTHGSTGQSSDCIIERIQEKSKSCPIGSVRSTSSDDQCVITISRQPSCPEGTAITGNGDKCARYMPKRKQCPVGTEPYGDVCASKEESDPVPRCPIGMTPDGDMCKMTTQAEPVCPPNTIDNGDGRCRQYATKALSCPPNYSPHGPDSCRAVLRERLNSSCPNGGKPQENCRMMVSVPLSPHCQKGKLYGGETCTTIEEMAATFKCPEGFTLSPTMTQICEKTLFYDCPVRKEEIKCSPPDGPTEMLPYFIASQMGIGRGEDQMNRLRDNEDHGSTMVGMEGNTEGEPEEELLEGMGMGMSMMGLSENYPEGENSLPATSPAGPRDTNGSQHSSQSDNDERTAEPRKLNHYRNFPYHPSSQALSVSQTFSAQVPKNPNVGLPPKILTTFSPQSSVLSDIPLQSAPIRGSEVPSHVAHRPLTPSKIRTTSSPQSSVLTEIPLQPAPIRGGELPPHYLAHHPQTSTTRHDPMQNGPTHTRPTIHPPQAEAGTSISQIPTGPPSAFQQKTQIPNSPRPTPSPSPTPLPVCHTVLIVESKTCEKNLRAQGEPVCPENGWWTGEESCLVEKSEPAMMKCPASYDKEGNCVVQETTTPLHDCPLGFVRKRTEPFKAVQEDFCEKVDIVAADSRCPPGSEPPDCETYTPKSCPGNACVTTHVESASSACPPAFNLKTSASGSSTCYRLLYTDREALCPQNTEEVDLLTCASFMPLTEETHTRRLPVQASCPPGFSDLGGDLCVSHEMVPGEVRCPTNARAQFDERGRATSCLRTVSGIIGCPPDAVEEEIVDHNGLMSGSEKQRCWVYSTTFPMLVDTVVQG